MACFHIVSSGGHHGSTLSPGSPWPCFFLLESTLEMWRVGGQVSYRANNEALLMLDAASLVGSCGWVGSWVGGKATVLDASCCYSQSC
jgi:hypothetical protein